MELKLTVDATRVYDEVLEPQALEDLLRFMDMIPYAWSNSGRYMPVWSWTEGAILIGPQWAAQAPDWRLVPPQGGPEAPQMPPDPPPLVQLLAKVREACAEMPGIPEIRGVHMLPYVWPPKSNISWHSDGVGRVGTFSFYVHREWNAEWGGEFMLTGTTFDGKRGQLQNEATDRAVLAQGHGTWISPVRNRLVINPSNMLHKTNKTTENSKARMSIQGFLFA